MAEMVLKQMLRERNIEGIDVDSCATSREEIGNGIYPPAKACLECHGIRLGRHVARQITSADIAESDMIFVMDRNNLRNLERMFGRDVACADNVRMLILVATEKLQTLGTQGTLRLHITMSLQVVRKLSAILRQKLSYETL